MNRTVSVFLLCLSFAAPCLAAQADPSTVLAPQDRTRPLSLEREAAFLFVYKEPLGLSEDQLKKIQAVLQEAAPQGARQAQAVRALAAGVREKLDREEPDAEGAKKLIDDNYLVIADSTKAGVDAYVKLQAVLTPEQKKKVKSLKEDLQQKRRARLEGARPQTKPA